MQVEIQRLRVREDRIHLGRGRSSLGRGRQDGTDQKNRQFHSEGILDERRRFLQECRNGCLPEFLYPEAFQLTVSSGRVLDCQEFVQSCANQTCGLRCSLGLWNRSQDPLQEVNSRINSGRRRKPRTCGRVGSRCAHMPSSLTDSISANENSVMLW